MSSTLCLCELYDEGIWSDSSAWYLQTGELTAAESGGGEIRARVGEMRAKFEPHCSLL